MFKNIFLGADKIASFPRVLCGRYKIKIPGLLFKTGD
jgi:hypothetical protein